MDLNSATGRLLGAVIGFVILCTKEQGYLLETSTDDRYFFSPAFTDNLVTRRLPGRTDTIGRFCD